MMLMMWYSAAAQTNTLVLQPGPLDGKDALLHELNSHTNYGTTIELIAFYWTFSGTPAQGSSLLEFNLSPLPSNIDIVSANLSLYYNPTSGSAGQAGNNACYLKKVTSPWAENTVTWSNMPTTNTINQVYLPTSTSSHQNYLNLDLTNFVIDWYNNPSLNYGVMLELIDASLYNSMKFCTSDYETEQLRPKLEINYNEVTNISENETPKVDFNVFPNPTSNYTTIHLNDFSDQNATISIFDAAGALVQINTVLSENTMIDVANYAKGIYMVKVNVDGAVSTKKLVVQ